MSIRKLVVSLALVSVPALSYSATPAIAYTEAGKFDSSFNEAVYRDGVSQFNAQYGHQVVEAEPESPSEYVEILTDLAMDGRSPIVAVGFSYSDAIKEVATEFPDIRFTIVDAVVDLPNVQSIVFKEHEGSFVVGAMAALKAKNDVIGFVGGVDIPIIRRFGCGFAQGAHYINDDMKVLTRMVSKDFSGFAAPDKGYEVANALISDGAEVIYAAAGRTGNGVYKAAAENDAVYAIGVDSNQNFLHVGTMLTSMVKKVGLAAYGSWKEAEEGTWSSGVKTLGLAEGGVDWQLDIFNRNLVTSKDEKQINKIRNDIISGKIKVVDYIATGQCPVGMIE